MRMVKYIQRVGGGLGRRWFTGEMCGGMVVRESFVGEASFFGLIPFLSVYMLLDVGRCEGGVRLRASQRKKTGIVS